MSNRYERMDAVTLYQQQKYHYEHILNPRATVKIGCPARKAHSLYHNNRTAHERDRLRKIDNNKMLASLLGIYNHKVGILSQKFEDKSASQKRKTFSSSFRKEQLEKEIRKENRTLFQSLLNAEPSVGSQKEWEKHFEQHLQMQQKLKGHLPKEYCGIKQFRPNLTRDKKKRMSKLQKKQNTVSLSQQRPETIILKKGKGNLGVQSRKKAEDIIQRIQKEAITLPSD